jgi:TPR repeat protein
MIHGSHFSLAARIWRRSNTGPRTGTSSSPQTRETQAGNGLGILYATGRGWLARDDREAVRLYKLAADRGSAGGQTNLGNMYRDGRGGLPKDDREAARLYKLAADQGDAGGQVSLGFFYETGRGGLSKDNREAVRLYKLAADQGNEYAQAALKRLEEIGARSPPPARRSNSVR